MGALGAMFINCSSWRRFPSMTACRVTSAASSARCSRSGPGVANTRGGAQKEVPERTHNGRHTRHRQLNGHPTGLQAHASPGAPRAQRLNRGRPQVLRGGGLLLLPPGSALGRAARWSRISVRARARYLGPSCASSKEPPGRQSGSGRASRMRSSCHCACCSRCEASGSRSASAASESSACHVKRSVSVSTPVGSGAALGVGVRVGAGVRVGVGVGVGSVSVSTPGEGREPA